MEGLRLLFRDRLGGRHCSRAMKSSSQPISLLSSPGLSLCSVEMEVGEPGLHVEASEVRCILNIEADIDKL